MPVKVLDFASASLLVQTLWVTRFAGFQAGLDQDLDEFTLWQQCPNQVAVSLVRRNEGGRNDRRSIGEQLGDFTNPANVFRAVFRSKTKILVQPHADVVAIQNESMNSPFVQQLIHCVRDGALSAAAQTP
jgi:hypothetical protein